MAVKRYDDENLSRSDFDTILEVNKKSIEIQVEVSDQNERILEALDDQEKKLDDIIEQNDELHKDLFKIQVLFASGILGLVIQLIQYFIKK